MGRRHVSLLASLAVALGLVSPAWGAITWREISHGPASAIQLISPIAFVAQSANDAKSFAIELPPNANNAIAHVDYSKNVVVAVLAGNGCRKHRFFVKTIGRRDGQLLLTLTTKPMPKGTDCLLLGPTYRVLLVPRKQLGHPIPTRADTRVASA